MIDIIIVNWNAGSQLENCVASILNSNLASDIYTIYIADNNSCDNSLQPLENLSGNLRIIRHKENLGFGRACNQAAKLGYRKNILLLNPDTIIEKNTINDAMNIIESQASITVLGCKHLDENGNIKVSCSRFPNFITSLNDITGLSKLCPKLFKPSTLMTDWDHSKSRFVDQVMGAFFLIRRSEFEKLNGFDEQFFLYYEDIDLAKRVSAYGGLTYYSTEISIFHSGMGTTNKIKKLRLYYSMSSRLKYYKKYFRQYQRFILLILMYLVEFPLRFMSALFRDGTSAAKEVSGAYKLLGVDKKRG